MKLKVRLSVALLLVSLVFIPTQANAATLTDLSKQFICQCGCTMVLDSCTHVECHSREEMTTLIKEELAQGKSEEQIIQLFVTRYGEQVLASPPKKGFNLVAWILPFAAILAGAGVIYVVIRRWVSRGKLAETDATVEAAEETDKYQRQLEEELKEFTEGSFR